MANKEKNIQKDLKNAGDNLDNSGMFWEPSKKTQSKQTGREVVLARYVAAKRSYAAVCTALHGKKHSQVNLKPLDKGIKKPTKKATSKSTRIAKQQSI